MKLIKVLVVDDSLVYTNFISDCISKANDMGVVATASNPYEARDMILRFKPDVMTLDVEMPKMDGISFLEKLMPQYPIPTVMVSSVDGRVFDAMKAGAVDFVLKPNQMSGLDLNNWIKDELITKIRQASKANVSNTFRPIKPSPATKKINGTANGLGSKTLKKTESNLKPKVTIPSVPGKDLVVALGASTGGTEALYDIIRQFKPDIPGTVVVQHMPPGFTRMYADRLESQCAVRVCEAADGDLVEQGKVLIAPGDKQMRLIRTGDNYRVSCKPGERVSGHCPSVDVLFESVASNAGKDAIGAIMTGMGADGSKGMLKMRKAGAHTVGQNMDTCVVYGMPKVAYDIGAVEIQKPLLDIPAQIYKFINMRKSER